MNKINAARRRALAFAFALLAAGRSMASDPAIDSLGSIATSSISNTKGPLLAVFAVILGVTVLFFAYRKIKGAAGGR